MRIGVFDSGLGGLTVLSSLLKVARGGEFFYFGDTARVPYGIRSGEAVINYSLQCVGFLEKFSIDLLVVACNTASAKAFGVLKKSFPHMEIYEVITPAVEEVVKRANQKVGVIGTPATVGSNIYPKRIKALKPSLEVVQKATPLFVPLVEEGLTDGPLVREAIKHYLLGWREKIDTLLLGCTHYPLLEGAIEELFPHWKIVNSASPLAQRLKPKLKGEGKKEVYLFFSDRTAFLERMVSQIPLKGEVKGLEIVSLPQG